MTSIIKVDTIQDQDGNNIINENANTITIGASGDTITIPAGATLANNGTATGFASIAWQSSIVTAATLSAVSGNGYWINTTSNACTITLPASAAVGDTIVFVDYARTWGTNAITIDQNSLNFQGNTSPNPEYNTDGQSVSITYSGATQGWIPTVDDDVTLETPQPYDIDFLVIAGGGGGGSRYTGGGGGAGGYRTSTQSIVIGTAITVTVGDGGAGGTNPSAGVQGSTSSISGSGLTTITSAGGGGGAAHFTNYPATSGGSGGGGAKQVNSGGSGNTPSTSPSQGNNGGDNIGDNDHGGGGGGASAVGGNGSGANGGVGGAGTASSITGSSVTRAGGGGGGGDTSGGAGGAGGGGAGSTSDGTAGTANTGGGGGGGERDGGMSGGAGGKGVVILSMPDANYTGTTTGSPTVATGVSGKTVLTFNGSGSYTA